MLSKRPEVLAAEFLQFEKVFGIKANLTEMQNFKTKVKKLKPEHDPEEIQRIAREKEKAERDA